MKKNHKKLMGLLGAFLLILTSLGLGSVAIAAGPLPYNITNNFGENASTQLLVLWHNSTAVKTQYIEYSSADDADFEASTKVAVEGVAWSTTGSVGEYSARNIFKTEISDLEPDSEYIYRVGNEGAWSQTFKHRTAEFDGTFSFTGVTDAQTASHEMMVATMKAANKFDPEHRFFLNTGDMVDYMGSQPGQIADYALKANQINNERVIATVLGNHETYGINNAEVRNESTVYNGFFYNPQNGLDGEGNLSRKNTSYYFYYNNVLFVMLNTVITNHNVQAEWVAEVLEADKNSDRPAQYIIVGAHYGPFGNYFYLNANMEDIKKHYGPIFTEYNVDMVMVGHDHTYSRTNPLKIGFGGQLDSFAAVEGGVIYVIQGTTGPKFLDGQEKSREQFAYCTVDALSTGCFVNVKVNREKLVVSARSTVGSEVNDTFEIMAKRGWSRTEFGEPQIEIDAQPNGALVDFGTEEVRSIKSTEILRNDGSSVTGIMSGDTDSYLFEGLRPQSTYYYILRLTFEDNTTFDTEFSFSTASFAKLEGLEISVVQPPAGTTKYILYLNGQKITEQDVGALYTLTNLEAFSTYLIKVEVYKGEQLLGYDLAFLRTTTI